MFSSDYFEMKEQHRNLLTHHRVFLLHNLRPGEDMWSYLLQKEVLAPEMLEKIKNAGTVRQQVAALLDLLPFRGPDAFDHFCDTLMKCDHTNVAKYIRTVEATEQFKHDIERQMGGSVSENQLEKFVIIFKKAVPAMQQLGDRQYEVLLEGHEEEMKKLDKLETKNEKLQLEVDHLKDVLKSCVEISESIASEVQENIPSKHFLSEEVTKLENLKKSSGNKQACNFYDNMATIVRYIEQHAFIIITSSKNTEMMEESCIQFERGSDLSLIDKLHNLSDGISHYTEVISAYPAISTEVIGAQLNEIRNCSDDMAGDVIEMSNKFSDIMKQRKKTNEDILSLQHNFQEIRRLELEQKQEEAHIRALNKQGQYMKRRMSKIHKQKLEEIQLNINQKKLQLANIQKGLDSQVKSADQRLKKMCKLLPEDKETNSNTDTLSESSSTPGPDGTRSLSAIFPRQSMVREPQHLTPSRDTPHATAISMDTSDEGQNKCKTSSNVFSVHKGVNKRKVSIGNNLKKTPEEEIQPNSGITASKTPEVDERTKTVIKKEVIEDQKTESGMKVGQAYKSKVAVPLEKSQSNLNSSHNLLIKHKKSRFPKTEPKTKLPDKESNEAEKGDSKSVLTEESERFSNTSNKTEMKLPPKRQHESLPSGSHSLSSSRKSTSTMQPTDGLTLIKKPQDNDKPTFKDSSATIYDTRCATHTVVEANDKGTIKESGATVSYTKSATHTAAEASNKPSSDAEVNNKPTVRDSSTTISDTSKASSGVEANDKPSTKDSIATASKTRDETGPLAEGKDKPAIKESSVTVFNTNSATHTAAEANNKPAKKDSSTTRFDTRDQISSAVEATDKSTFKDTRATISDTVGKPSSDAEANNKPTVRDSSTTLSDASKASSGVEANDKPTLKDNSTILFDTRDRTSTAVEANDKPRIKDTDTTISAQRDATSMVVARNDKSTSKDSAVTKFDTRGNIRHVVETKGTAKLKFKVNQGKVKKYGEKLTMPYLSNLNEIKAVSHPQLTSRSLESLPQASERPVHKPDRHMDHSRQEISSSTKFPGNWNLTQPRLLREDSNDVRRPGRRQAMNTKRVEPELNLPKPR